MVKPRKILLVGPPYGEGIAGIHSGGIGGYTRKMQLYLEYFRSDRFVQIPCFLTMKGQAFRFGLVGRFAKEFTGFLRLLRREKPAGIHLLGQYRKALYREFIFAGMAWMLGIPYLYEIKAGMFVNWYRATNTANRVLMQFILKNAVVVLAQGKPYVDFLAGELGIEAVYYPNFIAQDELQPFKKRQLDPDPLRIAFVGYAIKEKGIVELVEACRVIADRYPVQLTTVGAEHPDIKAWADALASRSGFTWMRKGRLSHEKVWEVLQENELYCYPTRYEGEGHNNTINEAMNSGLVTITTKAGFLESIIGNTRGYLLESGTAEEIVQMINLIMASREQAIQKTLVARKFLEEELIDTVAFAKLTAAYTKMTLPTDRASEIIESTP